MAVSSLHEGHNMCLCQGLFWKWSPDMNPKKYAEPCRTERDAPFGVSIRILLVSTCLVGLKIRGPDFRLTTSPYMFT